MCRSSSMIVFLSAVFFQMCAFGIMEKDGYPWNTKVNIDNEYEAELKKKYPDGGFFINLGPTGIRAQIVTDKPNQFLVKFVFQDSLSPAKGKIKIGDVIVGANGKDFSSHIFGRRGNRKGWGGPVMDLSVAIEDSQGKDGKLILKVWPGGDSKKQTNVEIQLKVLGRFAQNYPYDCERSEKMAKQLCDNIADYYNKNGKFGRIHVHSHAVLALMANGYKEHEKIVKKVVSGYASKSYDPYAGGFVTWSWGFDGILMGEYTNLYKDKSLKKAMESLSKVCAEGSKNTGIYTHRSYLTLDKMGKSPYAAIAGISGLNMLSLSMVKRAGYEYPVEFHQTLHQHYLNAAKPESMSIAYGFVNNAKNTNKPGIEPRHAIIRVKDPKKGLSGKGPGHECPTGMKGIGAYEVVWPTKADPRWKPLDWLEDEKNSNKVFEVFIDKGEALSGDGLRKVVRNHPDYKEPMNPEPNKAYKTTQGQMHCLPIGLGALAHLIDPENRTSWNYLGIHAANTAALSYENAFDGHAGGNIHAFWTVLGAGYADADKKRKFLDYMKCFLIMGETHYGAMIVQPLSRDRIGANGDPSYGAEMLPTTTAAILLSLAKKRLLITGALDGAPSNYVKKSSAKKAVPLKTLDIGVLNSSQKGMLNNVLLLTLTSLSDKGQLKKISVPLSKTKAAVWLKKAEGNGRLTFHGLNSTTEAAFKLTDLSEKDLAVLSRLVAALKPESKIDQGIAGVYMHLVGEAALCSSYLDKSSDEHIKKIKALLGL